MSLGNRKAVEALPRPTQNVNKRPDGWARARIDDGAPFVLPPALGDLLRIISTESRREEEGFVGWMT